MLIDSQKIPEKFVSATVASDLEDRIATIRQTLLSSGELKKIIDEFGLYKEERKKHFEEEILEMMRKDISITLEPVGQRQQQQTHCGIPDRLSGVRPHVGDARRQPSDGPLRRAEHEDPGGAGRGHLGFPRNRSFASPRSGSMNWRPRSAPTSSSTTENCLSRSQSLANTLSRLQTELEVNRDAINRAQQTRVILEGNLNAMEVTLAAQVRTWEQVKHSVGAGTARRVAPGQPQKKPSEVMQEQLDMLLRALQRESSGRDPAAGGHREGQDRSNGSGTAKSAAGCSQRTHNRSRTQQEIRRRCANRRNSRIRASRLPSLKAQIRGFGQGTGGPQRLNRSEFLHDLAMYQQRIERLPVREQEMAQIMRDYEMSKENYKSLLDKKMAAEMSLDMETRQQSERFTVLDRAQVPEKPIKPNRPLLYAGAAVLGLVLALVVGFDAELRRNVVLGEWELARRHTGSGAVALYRGSGRFQQRNHRREARGSGARKSRRRYYRADSDVRPGACLSSSSTGCNYVQRILRTCKGLRSI